MLANPAAVDVPLRILLSSWQAELISGERDEGVRRVRAESGANVQILDRTLPAAFRNRDECLAVIRSDGAEQLRLAINGTLRRAFKASSSRVNNNSDAEEKQRTVEVMIPEVACRHLVGAGGDRIKLLREEACCDVQLAPGVVAGVAAQRRVRCGGTLVGVAEAVARVHEVLVEFASIGILHPRHFDLQEIAVVAGASSGISTGHRDQVGTASTTKNSRVAVRLMVSKDECGWMIGKRGNKIHKLRELSLVSTRDADAEIMREGSESVVEIFGAPLSKELCVLQLIVDDLAMMREAFPITRLVVPMELRYAVADRLGDIKKESNAAAVSLVVDGQDWSVVELEGNERERLAAAATLHQILEQAAEQQAAVNGSGRSHTASTRSPVGLPGGRSVMANTSSAQIETSEPVRAPSQPAEIKVDSKVPQASDPIGSGHSRHLSLPQAATATTVSATLGAAVTPATTPAPVPSVAPTVPESSRAQEPPVANKLQELPAVASLQEARVRQEAADLRHRTPEVAKSRAEVRQGHSALRLSIATASIAHRLAGEDSGIARRAGVDLAVETVVGIGGWDQPVLVVTGDPVANAVACYLVQKVLWLDALLGKT